jgi:hypothetical protein
MLDTSSLIAINHCAGSLAVCTRSCIGVQKTRGFTKSVRYPGIVATVEKKL